MNSHVLSCQGKVVVEQGSLRLVIVSFEGVRWLILPILPNKYGPWYHLVL